jgi:hypothetical protein
MMPISQQCSICGQAFLGSDAIEIPAVCSKCKIPNLRDNDINYSDMVAFGLAPEGISRVCPNCGVWAHYNELNGKPKTVTCAYVECQCCGRLFEIHRGIRK